MKCPISVKYSISIRVGSSLSSVVFIILLIVIKIQIHLNLNLKWTVFYSLSLPSELRTKRRPRPSRDYPSSLVRAKSRSARKMLLVLDSY